MVLLWFVVSWEWRTSQCPRGTRQVQALTCNLSSFIFCHPITQWEGHSSPDHHQTSWGPWTPGRAGLCSSGNDPVRIQNPSAAPPDFCTPWGLLRTREADFPHVPLKSELNWKAEWEKTSCSFLLKMFELRKLLYHVPAGDIEFPWAPSTCLPWFCDVDDGFGCVIWVWAAWHL